LGPLFVGFLPNPIGHEMNFPESRKAKMPVTINIKGALNYYIFGFDRELSIYVLGGASVTAGELLFTAVRRQKIKTMKANHSIMQGWLPKKAGEHPREDSNTSYRARLSNLAS
jgi:hypothetical protein